MKKVEILENMAQEVYSWNNCFEDIANIYYSLDDLIENTSWLNKTEIARAIFFGDVRNWNDDIFYIGDDGNIYSCSIDAYERNILEQEDEIIDEFLDIYGGNLEDYQIDWLKELGIELHEGTENE